MQDYDLLYPGINQQAQTVRRNVAVALSNAHNEANPSKELADFLLDAASKAPGYTAPPAPELPSSETVVGNGKTAPTKTSTGVVTGAPSTIAVANGGVTGITLPATTAPVINGAKVKIGEVTFTFVVAGGKITDITHDGATGA